MRKLTNILVLLTILVLELISVKLIADDPPIGSFDTPEDGSTHSGQIAVTGWALDDVGVNSLMIYRHPVTGEGASMVFLGQALFIEGSRPDVAAAYPTYPNNTAAGWGLMILSNAFPNQGNGDFTLVAIATDTNGNQTTLGIKSIHCDNSNAVKPFGEMDQPHLGAIASGDNYLVYGWVLTPQPNTIPFDGSTIDIILDGVNVGHPVYNDFREDIASIFPDYRNSGGAGFYFYLNTESYANGLHTIYALVQDDAGNTESIGSTFFHIQNALNVDDEMFSGNRIPGGILLKWNTECNSSDQGFILSRSRDKSEEWIQIAHYENDPSFKIIENSPEQNPYSFIDRDAKNNLTYYYQLTKVDQNGIPSQCADIIFVPSGSAENQMIQKIYPNPSSSLIHIEYQLDINSRVRIIVLNEQGKQVKILLDNEVKMGHHEIVWDGTNDCGNKVSGKYFFVRMEIKNKNSVYPVILLGN